MSGALAAPTLTDRATEALERALGPAVLAELLQPGVTDLVTNEAGGVLVKTYGSWRLTEHTLASAQILTFLGAAATAAGGFINDQAPDLAVQLPGGRTAHARLQAFRPPLTPVPTLTLRTHSQHFTLSQLVDQGVVDSWQSDILRRALELRLNILIIGATGSGKTSFLDTLLGTALEIAPTSRIVLLQDVSELQCAAPNLLRLFTCANPHRDLSDLVRATLRVAPDRIVVGEVRGPEALHFLDACCTGHPGGLATLHAESPKVAVHRLDRLITRNNVPSDLRLIGEAINLIAHLVRGRERPKLADLVRIHPWSGHSDLTYSALHPGAELCP